jgi:hypothetical protein
VAQVSQLSPELARGVMQLARALMVATRSWGMYPPEHPTVRQAVERFAEAVKAATAGGAFGIGITPETLLVE